ncbi:MAG: KH domain-containing protein [Thermoanaerobaculia bacterium]
MSEVNDDLANVLTLLVDSPRDVAIQEDSGEDRPRLEVTVADGDLGKVIGRQGRTARALRRVLAARAAHGDSPWELKILDN